MVQGKRDPEGTKRKILEAATGQFAAFGLEGARVDAISMTAGTNERMLYYYFESKEGLYVAVLEAMYADFAARESRLDLAGLSPSHAIRSIAQSIWAHFREHPEWLNLINNENLHEGRYAARSTKLGETLSPVVELIRQTLERGAETGEFRDDVDALDFYVTLVSMGFYVVSSRFTLKMFANRDYSVPTVHAGIEGLQIEMLLAYLRDKPTAHHAGHGAPAGPAAREVFAKKQKLSSAGLVSSPRVSAEKGAVRPTRDARRLGRTRGRTEQSSSPRNGVEVCESGGRRRMRPCEPAKRIVRRRSAPSISGGRRRDEL